MPQFRALTAIPSNLLAALSHKIFARAQENSLSLSLDAIKIFFAERHFASGARCTPRETAHTGLPGESPADHVAIITRPGTGQKFGTLEPHRYLEMLLASRGQVELFGEQPTRGPTVSFLSLFLFLSYVPHPPPRRFLFPLFLFSRSVPVSLRFSLSSTFSFARLHSYTPVPQARQRRDQATKKDHLVLYILAPAAMILSTAFKNIRRPCWISQRKSMTWPDNRLSFYSEFLLKTKVLLFIEDNNAPYIIAHIFFLYRILIVWYYYCL